MTARGDPGIHSQPRFCNRSRRKSRSITTGIADGVTWPCTTSSPLMSTPGVFSIGLLLFTGATYLYAADPINTPFELVPLWSEEMLSHLTGRVRAGMSGPNAGTCERRNTGLCDGTMYLGLSSHDAELQPDASHRMPAKQSNSANPQFFKILSETEQLHNDLPHRSRYFKRIDLFESRSAAT